MPVFGPTGSDEALYTVGYLINRTFDLLLGAAQEDLNVVASNVDIGDATVSLSYPSQRAQPGAYIAIDDEVMYVLSALDNSSGGCVLGVIRHMKGTTATAHSLNAIAYVNPYFAKYQVRRTLQDEIRSWGPQIFAPKSKVIAATDFVRGYDLGELGRLYRVLDVQRSPDSVWGSPPNQSWPSVKWRMVNQADTTAFPSGQALMIVDPIGVFDEPSFNVVYAAPIDVDTTFNDDDSVIAMGMDSSELDIAPYGAAWRLASGREIRRMLTESMGNTADMANFPPGYMIKTAEEFKMLRNSRLQDAEERLLQQYPVKRM
jgi:hypothetical protein